MASGAGEKPNETHLYRCVCGTEYQVDLVVGGQCHRCFRKVQAEAVRQAMAATVTVGDVTRATALHLPDHEMEDTNCGRLLGHFRLDQRLGSGGMGTVYRALDTSLQRYVAVKVVRDRGDGESTKRIEEVLQEAVAQARLNHPNVVTIYYVGSQDDEPFLAMELVSGPPLSERIQLGTLPYAQLVRFVIQVADALRHAQQFGIVHADIKPANLLMSGDEQIKLSDFGLSRINVQEQDSGQLAGTPAYLAPELTNGSPVSIQSDMYALGVTLFQLAFGRPPYELKGTTVQERLASHHTADIDFPQPWPRNVPRELMRVIERLLAKDPSDRYADYGDLLTDLRQIEPVSTTTAGFAPRAMAYTLDQCMLLMAFAPFALVAFLLSSMQQLERYSWIVPVLPVLALITPLGYLAAIRQGWRSLGHYLFQLRVVDEYGLPLRNDLRATREFLRCMFSWLTPLAAYVGMYWSVADTIIDSLLGLFLVCDVTFFFYTRNRTTLHDWLCKARVVLDSRPSIR
jgi:uncharacterized RDD family membrane protein YckC